MNKKYIIKMAKPYYNYDNKPHLSCRHFTQCKTTGYTDTLYLMGDTCVCDNGTINSNSGYKISGQTIFDTGKGVNSLQIGCNAQSNGSASIVIGHNSHTTGNTSIVIGGNSYDCFDNSIIIGYNSLTNYGNASNSILLGNQVSSCVQNAIGIGCNTSVEGNSAIAIGSNVCSCAACAFTIGKYITNTKPSSFGLGWFSGVTQQEPSILLSNTDSYIYGCGDPKIGFGIKNPLARLDILATGATSGFRLVDGNQSIGNVLTSDANGYATWSLPTGGGAVSSVERITKTISQIGHTFNVKDVVGFSAGSYNKPIADGTYDGEVLGLITRTDTNGFDITQAGYVTGLTNLTASTTYFLSDTTSGLLTSIAPTADTHINKAILIAVSETAGWVLPYPGYVITTGSTSTGGTGGITWCGSTTDGIATYVDSTHICSESGLRYDGSKLEFANGQTRCISMEAAPPSGSSGLRIYGAPMIASGGNAGSVGIIGGLSTYCSAANGGHVCLYGGTGCACASFGVAYGGCVDIQGGMGYFSGGTGCTTGGHVCICAGRGYPIIATTGTGGNVYIWGGCGRSNGGNVNISAGHAVSGTGGYVALSACTVALLACSSSCVELYYNGSAKFKTINTGVCAIGRLDVSNDVQLLTNGGGIIMCSPNGTKYCLTVTDGGALTVTAI